MVIKSRLILLYYIFMYKVMALITVVDKGVLPLVGDSVGIIFYVDVTNDDRQNICKVYSECKRCCLIDSKKKDCDITTAFGEDIQTINPKDRKTLTFVAPIIIQHDLVGNCDFSLIYLNNNTEEVVDVTIPFDTQVGAKKSKELMKEYVGRKKNKHCTSHDEDSLNNCKPVDCSIKYLDKRPVFDRVLNKCVEAPICITNPYKELPDNVYVPNSNICRNLEMPLTVQDIYVINTGLGTVTMSSELTSAMKVKVLSNCSTISQNINLLRDLIYGKMCLFGNEVTLDYNECLKSALFTIVICVISICSCLFVLVGCVNCSTWLYILYSDGKLSELWKICKNPFKRKERKQSKSGTIVNNTIRNALLREVIVKDIPLELRNSVIDVCDRMGKEVKKKKRYREADVGSQVSLQKKRESSSSTSSLLSLEEN